MMLYYTPAPIVAIVLFFLLVASYITGHYVRKRNMHLYQDSHAREIGTIGSTLLGLLALLLAFTFGMANNRFDYTRQMVMEEVNAIGTAIRRAEVYPDSVEKELKNAMKNYVELRIQYYEVGYDNSAIYNVYLQSGDSLKKIWNIANAFVSQGSDHELKAQLLPAINTMMDVTTARIVARETTVPPPLLYFLFILCISTAFLLGYERVGKIDWTITVGFTLMLSLTIFIIMDIDRPRRGLFNLNQVHVHMYELRDAL
jgi:hypothetical protein